MKISVIIPFYNAETYLRECLDSVTGQTLEDIEILCIDDGSTDGSASLVEELAVRYEGVRLLRQVNGGPGAARNAGIRAARGEYLFFLDADDRIADDGALEALLACAEMRNAEVVLAGARQMSVDGADCGEMSWVLRRDLAAGRSVIEPQKLGDALFFLSGAVPWAKLFRRAFVIRESLFFPELRRSEDFPFVQLAVACAARLVILDRAVLSHRIRVTGSLESAKDAYPRAFGAGERHLWGEILRRRLGPTVERAARARAIPRIVYNMATLQGFASYCEAFEEAREVGAILGLRAFTPEVGGLVSACERVAAILSSPSAGDSLLSRVKKFESSSAGELSDPDVMVREFQRVCRERDSAIREVGNLKHSVSYRLGLFVTWPLRFVYSRCQCSRENGDRA